MNMALSCGRPSGFDEVPTGITLTHHAYTCRQSERRRASLDEPLVACQRYRIRVLVHAMTLRLESMQMTLV